MKSFLPILAIVLFFTSCTTSYKSGQTPDDVYYSPQRPQDEYVRVEKDRDRDREYRYEDEGAYRDDRYLRMKVRNRRYTGMYEDYYSYNPYYYHYYNSNLYYNSPWSTYSYWNYYYNPYCSPCISCGTYPVRTTVKSTRTFDLSVYNPNQNSNTVKGINIKGSPTTSYGNNNTPASRNYGSGRSNTNYGNSNRNAGDFLRDVFSGSGNSSSSGSSKGSSSSSSSSSSGSSSGKSTNAGTRKF